MSISILLKFVILYYFFFTKILHFSNPHFCNNCHETCPNSQSSPMDDSSIGASGSSSSVPGRSNESTSSHNSAASNQLRIQRFARVIDGSTPTTIPGGYDKLVQRSDFLPFSSSATPVIVSVSGGRTSSRHYHVSQVGRSPINCFCSQALQH